MTVSLSPLAGAGWQFSDENGNPLAGGLLYTYQAGTTTPAPTYTTSAGNVTNTNPIILNSAGRPPNQVWLNSTDSFKFVLKTSAGVDVWSQDNVYGVASAALIEGLSGPNGSALIGFVQTGANAITRTVQAKLREWVSITDYGASPSATTAVNSAAIQAAFVEANVRKCAVYVPGANSAYRVSDEFTIPQGVTVYGDGYSSFIQQTVAGKNIFIAGNDTIVRNLHLKMCPGNNLNIAKQNCVAIINVKNVHVLNNWLELVDINSGVYIASAKDVTVDNNIIYGATWTGGGPAASAADIILYSGTESGRFVITNNYCFSNNSQGIFANALGLDSHYIIANNVCITLDPSTCVPGGTWEEIATGGVRRHGIITQYSNQISNAGPGAVVTGNVCRNTRWSGIYLQGTVKNNGLVVANNVCSRNNYANWPLGGGIYLTVSGEEIVANNFIYECQGTTGNGGITITAVFAPTGRAKISGNTIQNSAGIGLYLSTNAANIDIIDNTFSNNASSAIVWAANGGNASLGGFYIANNTITRPASAATTPAISVTPQIGVVPTYITGNKIYGSDSVTLSATNTAIRLQTNNPSTIVVKDNMIESFYYGMFYASYFANNTRHINMQIEGNIFTSCAVGIAAAATTNTVTVPLIDNRFINVPTPTNPGGLGGACGYIGTREGLKLVVETAAAPIFGTWAVGDRTMFTTPVSGGYIGSVCTVAGSPGTWRSFGLIV